MHLARLPFLEICHKWIMARLRPVERLTDPEARQQARLLLAVLLVFQLSGGLVLLFETLTHPTALNDFDFRLTILIWLSTFALRIWARRGYTRRVATILIAELFTLFVVAPFTPNSLPSLPYYVVVPLFLSALFFSVRWTLLLAGLAMAIPIALTLLTAPVDATARRGLIEDLLFLVPVASLILVFIQHRSMIERIHQAELQAAIDRVRASEARLAQRVGERTQELRSSEHSLGEALHRYYALFEQTHDAVFIMDLDGHHLEANQRAAEMLGFSLAELNTLSVNDLSAEPDQTELVRQRLMAGEAVPTFERVFRKKDGSRIPVEINVELVRDLDGNPLHIQSVARDISTRKAMEADLRTSHDDLDHFFTLALDLLCIADTEGHFLKVNKAWEAILGYTVEELNGRLFLDFIHPDDLQATLDTIARLVDQEPVYYFTNRYKGQDGSYRYIEWHSYPVGERIFAAARDITERKQSEEALRRSEERLALTLQSSQAGTWEWNVPTGQTVFNERWAEMLGYTLAELSPTTVNTWSDFVHPQDYPAVMRILEKHLAGESEYYECEMRMRHNAGHWVWIWARGMVMERAADGQPLRMFGTHIDITARKLAEQHTFDLALEKERVLLLRQFIEKASHEFRTPLSIINSNTFLITRARTSEKLPERVQMIRAQVTRMARLVETLVLLSRLESDLPLALVPVDPIVLLDGVCQRMVARYGPRPALHYAMPPPPAQLMGSADYLQDAFQQILDNAYRFTPAAGTITVTGEVTGAHFRLEVSDTGPGIQDVELPHIFETFWRHDEAHSTPGLGLGLPIAQKIISAHGGTLEVESTFGAGTTVRVVLPVPAPPVT